MTCATTASLVDDAVVTGLVFSLIESTRAMVRMEMSGHFVYFIGENPYDGGVKIGRSRDPKKRLKQCQTGSRRRLTLMRVIKCDSLLESMQLESSLHQQYNDIREDGEWFTMTEQHVSNAYFETMISMMANKLAKLEDVVAKGCTCGGMQSIESLLEPLDITRDGAAFIETSSDSEPSVDSTTKIQLPPQRDVIVPTRLNVKKQWEKPHANGLAKIPRPTKNQHLLIMLGMPLRRL